MQRLVGLVLIASVVGRRDDDDTSPTTKVVNLLKDLQGKILADEKSESQIYNKYACWCETTTKAKAESITHADSDLRALGQQILSLKGKVSTLSAEIKELNSKLAENEEEQEEATSLREKRNGKFMARQAETKEALKALQQAIKVLVKGSSSLLQTDTAAQATASVQSVLEKLPSEASANLDDKNVAFLSEFVANGADGTYAPQSATIQGILTDMYNTFATDLEDATTTEANQNKNYEKLTATLEKEASEMKEVKSRKEGQKIDAESDLADTTATYDDTQEQMKADIKFFDQTKEACTDKHADWTLRQKLRKEELAGVEKALGFLTSDAARDLFKASIKPGVEAASFLQIADDAEAVAFKAYGMLKAQASKSKSLRLASLAVRIRTTKVGHFDAVIKSIDTMMSNLDKEGAADLAKKTQCENEYQSIAKTVQDLDWKIKNNEAKIDKLGKLIDLRREEKHETMDQIGETKDYKLKISDERKAEHEEFGHSQKDDEAAIELISLAKDSLTAYYKKHDIDMGEVQGSVKLLQADPEFEVSKDQAPDADFSGKGSNKVQSKGIVSMMSYIIEDLEDEVENGKKAEAKAQEDYEAEMKTADDLEKDLEAKKSNLENIIAKRNSERTDEKKTLQTNDKDREAELKYEHEIKPDCDWIIKAFDDRATARSNEKNGLLTAKEFLAGKSALLQLNVQDSVKDRSPGIDKLAGIGFLGVQ